MRPLIGIAPSIKQDGSYYKVSADNMLSLEQAGGIPLVLPYLESDSMLEEAAERLDGLYLTGGHDIDPVYFNEEPHPSLGYFHPDRDRFEIKIIQKMLEKNKPILGVCKGAQMLNLAAGGDMYQDLLSQFEGELVQHSQKAARSTLVHEVELAEGSLIHRLIGSRVTRVNSYHHQANRTPGKDLAISGRAQDRVAEAVESTKHRFALGLQWHPENLNVHLNHEPSRRIFEGFIEACRQTV